MAMFGARKMKEWKSQLSMIKSDRLIVASVNIATGQCLIQAYPKGNGEHSIQYLKYLMSQYNDKRIALIWDGAKYHSSAEVKNFLSLVNNG